MMRRILDALRRRPDEQSSMRPLRPNELRREVVQSERRRREARAAVSSPVLAEDERPRREPLPTPPVVRGSEQTSLPGALKTRADLRQAWLMKEILDTPVSMRGPYRDR